MIGHLRKIADSIEKDLDEKDTVRELALKSSRAIIRLSGAAIRSMHRGEDPTALLNEARDENEQLRGVLAGHSDIASSGFVTAAQQELSEAMLLYSIISKKKPPTPKQLGVSTSAYLLSLGDVIGELRRISLEAIRVGEVERAVETLDMMEEMYDVLMRFDYPDGLVPVRKKQDLARTLIEKTRSEVTFALKSRHLERSISALQKELKEG